VNAALSVIYTIYESPKDYPGMYVVRRYFVDARGPVADVKPLVVTKDLEKARGALPVGVYPLGRQPDDDPVILESWI
jgi:hypothetical protein